MITIVRQYVCQYYTQCLCKVRIVIMISAAMVNTQTHTQTVCNQLYYKLSQLNYTSNWILESRSVEKSSIKHTTVL